ncbi:major facilitator superfamily domain-containing protein 6-like [Notolabrus celidotus]|uniref:major facilitator superfamily domain-containing protein 6-like n=1 Tax=Notolabrus celidotus TaxID=1203425 RepID=UPI00148F941E|nr:major facilitator superfamily domain-containing protein 6-like [Notolabrus celidotus]
MKINKQIDVKRALALSGALNFLCSCARACLLPFLTLFFRQLGLTPAMTGVIMGTKHFITLVWSPVGSLLAKHYNKRRVVLTCSLVCSAAVPLVLLLIPPAGVHKLTDACNTSEFTNPTPSLMSGTKPSTPSTTAQLKTTTAVLPRSNVTLSGDKSTPALIKTSLSQHTAENPHPQKLQVNASSAGNGSHEEPKVSSSGRNQTSSSITNQTSSSVTNQTSSSLTNQTSSSGAAPARQKRKSGNDRREVKTKEEESNGGHFEFLGSLKVMDPEHQLFFLVLITVSVWESAWAPLEWTADDGLYEYLDFADSSDRYRSMGVWGLLGAVFGVGGAGFLVSQLRCVVASHAVRSAVHFYSYAAVVALAVPVAIFLPLHLNKKRDKANGLLKAAQLVRGSPRALLCAATTLLVGAACSAVDNFLLWQMQDHGSNKLHMGLSLALALLSQAAFPLLAARVSKHLTPGRVLTVGAATLGLQCFYYSFLWGPWAALPAQVFSSFSTGAVWWAVEVQCEDVATPGAERSVRRVFSSLSFNLGSGLGSFAGGLVVQRFGVTWVFRGAAVCLMMWCVCLPLLQWKAPRQRRINYSRLLAADGSEGSDSESEQERDWLDKAMEDDRSNNNNNNNNNNNYGRRTN